MTHDLKSTAGRLLYRHLPEEYRYRDNPEKDEMGDLEAYLDGFGCLMDLFQSTLAQAYADGFAEPADEEGGGGRSVQSWMLPYLASLLGANLLAPDLDGTGDIRRAELGQSVAWSKGKGTLRVVDSMADVMADTETYTVEGWKRVAMAPRLNLPPFSLPSTEGETLSVPAPLGTPDLRHASRPVIDESGSDPLQSFQIRERDADGMLERRRVYWASTNRAGVPCFPNSYADMSVTSPDIRSHALKGLGPEPRRVAVFVQPQDGFFTPEMLTTPLTTAALEAYAASHRASVAQPVRFGPAEVLAAMGLTPAKVPDRINITGDLVINAGQFIAFEKVNILGKISVKSGGQLVLSNAAVSQVVAERPEPDTAPNIVASNSLLGQVLGPAGFVRLEYVTVLGRLQTGRIQASDCIFVGVFDDPTCFDTHSCVRFSSLPATLRPETCQFARARSNTRQAPRFVRRPLASGNGCAIRTAAFGEPGCGVLALDTHISIRQGSEDGTEMGAFHALGYLARLAALERKLLDQIPFGQTLTLIHDPMLAQLPPAQSQ